MPTSLNAVVDQLFLAITSIAGYPLPAAPPAIHVIPAAEVQHKACNRPCRVKAMYDPDAGVFLSDDMNLDDAYARSVLMHELVHHQQHLHAKFDHVADACERSYQLELEAYNVQNWYLKRHGQDLRFVIGQLPNLCAGDKPAAKPWMSPPPATR